MFQSLFDLPLLVAGPVIVGSLCLYAVLGLWIARSQLQKQLRNYVSQIVHEAWPMQRASPDQWHGDNEPFSIDPYEF